MLVTPGSTPITRFQHPLLMRRARGWPQKDDIANLLSRVAVREVVVLVVAAAGTPCRREEEEELEEEELEEEELGEAKNEWTPEGGAEEKLEVDDPLQEEDAAAAAVADAEAGGGDNATCLGRGKSEQRVHFPSNVAFSLLISKWTEKE